MVVGSAVRRSNDALVVTRRAAALGFSTTVGIIHDHHGQLLPLNDEQRGVLDTIAGMGASLFDFANYNRFQRNLANGVANDWHCGAGSRYLYICEDGLVQWCSQQRGHPGMPLEHYGADDLRREYHAVKSCAPHCTVGCVHRVAQVDELRHDPQAALAQWFAAPIPGGQSSVPLPVKVLRWAFVTSPGRDLFRDMAVRLLAAPRRSRAR